MEEGPQREANSLWRNSMTNLSRFQKLLSPFEIKHLKLKNRMVKAPQSTQYVEPDNFVNERVKNFYESVAAGGVGMIVIGALYWDIPWPGCRFMGIYDDKFVPGLRDLVQVIHKHGCPVFAQLHHAGPSALFTPTGDPPIGPSSLHENELPSPVPLLKLPRGLTIPEIEDMEERHTLAVKRAQLAGFDGVEVHAAHGYLWASFLTRIWNKRADDYGCQNIRNRARVVVEVIKKIKDRLGSAYPVGVRINGEEWGSDRRLTPEESSAIAKILEEAGADYISVTGYGYGPLPFRYCPDYWPYPEPEEYMKSYMQAFRKQGILIPGAKAIKKAVSIPVIGVGRLTPELAEEVLQQGEADLIAFGRSLWADPELPNKVASGRLEDIAPCTRCAICEDPPSSPRRCRINASFGKEKEYVIKPADRKKKVMVVGGGPAGMEVARVATLRGHEVILYEKTSKLGGLLPLAAMIKGFELEDLLSIVRYLETQMTKLNVDVQLGIEGSIALIEKVKPDVVVIATGGASTVPKIPGIDRPNVLSSSTLYKKVQGPLQLFGPKVLRLLTNFYLPVGKRVLITGGLIEGCQVAVYLVKRGRRVTIVEESDQLGKGMPERFHFRLIPWFAKKGVETFTGVKYEEITDKGLTLVRKDGKRETIEADTIMVTMPQKPDNSLYKLLEGKVQEVYMVGACNGAESGLIVNAFDEGRRIGCTI
jgi:2,4-dienoyl-CoA reductase (NADPH2)